MKKNLFFAAAAIAALASCSSDETLSVNENANFVDGDLVPVELGLSRNSVSVSQTRGTGTVGGTTNETNVYNNEDLYVLMTTVGVDNWGCTEVGSLGVQFDASFFSRPTKTTTTDEDGVWAIDYLTYTNGRKKYYPVNGTYSDFFAFYVDDAATIKGVAEESDDKNGPYLDTENSTMTVDFKINGTQDLLAGKADNGEPIPNSERTGFSAKTARGSNSVIPSIPMKHLLTRLTFAIEAGDKNADGIKINSIGIESRSEGTLTVAYDEEGTKSPAELIEWKGEKEKPDTLYLYCDADEPNAADGSKSKLELKDELLTINWDEENQAAQKVGHAMFVEPNQETYKLIISYSMPYQAGEGTSDYFNMTEKYKVSLGAGQVLELGKSYNVVIKVYGLSEIELKTTLEKWDEYPDPIPVDTDDPQYSWQ